MTLTKIFHFEMAHAIHGYPGGYKNIHGHSYELHVTVTGEEVCQDFIPAPGLILDFKELKHLVNTVIIKTFDHKLVLSHAYLANNPAIVSTENLFALEAEPTAENLLLYIKQKLITRIPVDVKLVK